MIVGVAFDTYMNVIMRNNTNFKLEMIDILINYFNKVYFPI